MALLAVDLGARYADFCLLGAEQRALLKQPATASLADTIKTGARVLGCNLSSLRTLRLATTRPLNALLAQKSEQTALIATKGFTDVMQLARQDRADLYDPIARSPAPSFLVDQAHVFASSARMDADGREVQPFDVVEASQITSALSEAGITSVAVALLHAHVNPAHELAIAATLLEKCPDVSVSLSHLVDPALREYERTVATLIDAWLRCEALPQIRQALDDLRAAGFAGEFELADNRGVVVSWDWFLADPTSILAGGPAAAVTNGARVSANGSGIFVVIGSASTDICQFEDGEPVLCDPALLADIEVRRPGVDSISKPFGGRTRLEWSGDRLLLEGPGKPALEACLSALGRFEPAASEPADPKLAIKLVQAAADYVAEAIVRYATARNIDPVTIDLVIGGGTGNLIAAEIAHALGRKTVSLPLAPALAGACGLAEAPHRREASIAVERSLDDLSETDLRSALDNLEQVGLQKSSYRILISPRPLMHHMTLVAERRPETLAALRKLYVQKFREINGVQPPGPGFVGRVSASVDTATNQTPKRAPDPLMAHGPQLCKIQQGAIWVPEGWYISALPSGYMLRAAT